MDRHWNSSFFLTSTVFSRNLTVTTKYFYIAFWARINTIRAFNSTNQYKLSYLFHLLQKHIVLLYYSFCAFVTKYEANMQNIDVYPIYDKCSCPSTKYSLNILLCVFQEERELFSLCLHVRIEDVSLIFHGSF